ncbi:MAG: hemolysin family protein [Prevotellaceae bacterium]|jgi:putative hemolysin|nr:hemolysin family protein [Prevotellaceae bacterium]
MEYLIIILLILLNGFFALSEIAIVSCKRSKLELLQRGGNAGAVAALRLQADSENFLSAIQVGITLVSIITGLVGGNNLAREITPLLEQIPFLNTVANEVSMTVSILLVTYFSIVFGELVPKTIGFSNPEKVAANVAPIIRFLSIVLFPFVKILAGSTNIITKTLGIKKVDDKLTEPELRQILRTASSEGVIEEEQNIFHENIFNFSDKKAQHLMTYRSEVEWIDIDEPFEEIRKELLQVAHSKIVCCKGDLDNFLGVLQLKDFYKSLYLTKKANIKQLLVPPITISEKANAQYVLDQLRTDESRVCFVVNEFGGLEGIITLYDVMENIVGRIPEDGIDDPDVQVRADNSVLVSGDAPVETLVGIIDDFVVNFEQVDYYTVAGFVLSIINEIPITGYTFTYQNYEIEIVDMDGHRIDKILIRKK